MDERERYIRTLQLLKAARTDNNELNATIKKLLETLGVSEVADAEERISQMIRNSELYQNLRQAVVQRGDCDKGFFDIFPTDGAAVEPSGPVWILDRDDGVTADELFEHQKVQEKNLELSQQLRTQGTGEETQEINDLEAKIRELESEMRRTVEEHKRTVKSLMQDNFNIQCRLDRSLTREEDAIRKLQSEKKEDVKEVDAKHDMQYLRAVAAKLAALVEKADWHSAKAVLPAINVAIQRTASESLEHD